MKQIYDGKLYYLLNKHMTGGLVVANAMPNAYSQCSLNYFVTLCFKDSCSEMATHFVVMYGD